MYTKAYVAFCKIKLIELPFSHCVPVNPVPVQSHVYILTSLPHKPEFMQGLELHSSISAMKVSNEKLPHKTF